MSNWRDEVSESIRALIGERLVTTVGIRDHHSGGLEHSQVEKHLPDAVAFVETTEEVSHILRLCDQYRVPVVPYGAGTSQEGHTVPVAGGLSLDLSRMDAILEVNPGDFSCRVQAGVCREQLNAHLRDMGLFFPVDPGANASLGGMCSTRASGTLAVGYGNMRHQVLGLTVVRADGGILTTGGRVVKSSTGYDLTGLFVGAEGTLGVVTEVQLRLHSIPEATSAAICQFETLHAAATTAAAIMQAGIRVARIELFDDLMMGASIAYSKLTGMAALPTLMLEFHGSPVAVEEAARLAKSLAEDAGSVSFDWSADAEQRTRLWKARHEGYFAGRSLRPGWEAIGTDTVVPMSRLVEAIEGAKRDLLESGFVGPIVGHVGDGNFHAMILYPPNDPDAHERAMAVDRSIVRRAIALGGSCSGEHGIGLAKREFLEAEHGAAAVALMRQLKAALDPHGILNPGKIFPETF